MKPLRAWAVLDAFDQTTGEHLAAVGAGVFVDADGDRRWEGAFHIGCFSWLHSANTTRRQIKCDAAHTQSVLTVGGNGDLDHRINFAWIILGQPVDELVANLARGQFDDAVVFVRQLQLAFRGHHAVAFDATDFANCQCHVNARHIVARFTQNHGDAFPRVRCAANDLLIAFIGFHRANAQTVCIGVLFGVLHLGQRKPCKALGGVFDPFHFQTQIGQGFADLVY